MKKHAFTLAEVLITLGVIGVVAAMTVPVLISKIQLKIFETALKKEYSTLQNTINYIMTSEELSECYLHLEGSSYQAITDDCNKLHQNLIKTLNLKPADKNMCMMYAERDDVLSNGGSAIHKAISYDYYFKNSTPYFQKNGSVIFFPDRDVGLTSIIFDVNGKKGPNKWGYDIFWMNLTRRRNNTGPTRLTDEYMSIKEKGGRFPREILRGQPGSNTYEW